MTTGYLFGEATIYRLDQEAGYMFPVQLKTEKFEGRIDNTETAFEDFNNYLRSSNPIPQIYELIYIPKSGIYDDTILEGIKGSLPTIELVWRERVLPNRRLNWLVWHVDEQYNKLSQFGYYFYLPLPI